MISEQLVDLSRLQFAATAMYHFLFVPLTIGMVWLLVIMESVYVMTGKTVWKDMTRFWGKLFGINFAPALDAMDEERVQAVCDYLQRHLAEPIYLAEAARVAIEMVRLLQAL